MMNITDSFIDHLYAMANELLPERVKEQAALCAIDYLGCAAAGSRVMAERNEKFLNAVKKQIGENNVI